MFSNSNATTTGSTPTTTAKNDENNDALLNLFPSTTTPQAAQLKLRRLLHSPQTNYRPPTQIQYSLAVSLYDDAVEYMSTLEMNRAASYTFGFRNSYGSQDDGTPINSLGGGGTRGESVADEMWEMLLDLTLCRSSRHSVSALTKTLNLIRHVLLHGSEACVTDGALLYRVETAVEPLRRLNTALEEQRAIERILENDNNNNNEQQVGDNGGFGLQQLTTFGNKATAAMMKLRGGSVDAGHPVREAAAELHPLASVPGNLAQIRLHRGMPQNSLVPVGSANVVGYITDEGRLRLLQEKMAAEERSKAQEEARERRRLTQTKSNLAGRSASDGFGGGYSASGGGTATVVGAAHSLEDMIASARHELERHKSERTKEISALQTGFCDDPAARARHVAELEMRGVQTEPELAKRERELQDALEYLEEMQKLEQEKVGDLLEGDFTGGAASGNASGSGATVAGAGITANGGGGCAGADLLGFGVEPGPSTPAVNVFGGAAPPPSSTAGRFVGGDPNADLLGFGGATGMPGTNPMMGGNDAMGRTNNLKNDANRNAAVAMGASIMGGQATSRPPPSAASNFAGVSPDLSSAGEASEDALAETSRRMQMAAGLFAGVVPPNDDGAQNNANPQKNPVMAMGNNSGSRISALDDLIPAASMAAPTTSSNESAFGAGLLSSAMSSSGPSFGMGPMGGSTGDAAIPPAAPAPSMMAPTPPGPSMGSSSDIFGMGPMGGSTGDAAIPLAAPVSSMMAPTPPGPSMQSSSDPFGMMGSVGNVSATPPSSMQSLSDPFGMGSLGGPAAPPSMPPPPPPVEPPPPAPSMAPQTANAQGMAPLPNPMQNNDLMGNNNSMGNNSNNGASVEQMQEMIRQQQAQMAQMMQMMQSMQMQGGGGTNNGNGGNNRSGGWP